MEGHRLRVYLTGELTLVRGGRVIGEESFPARQGRRAFAYLVCSRSRAVSRDTLAEAIWGEHLPQSWESALNALVSKLRRLFLALDLPPEVGGIGGHIGYYHTRLPLETWIDMEAAASELDVAEGALRRGHWDRALASATQVVITSRRPFLNDEEGWWIEQQRARLQAWLVRGLECLSTASLRRGEPDQAVRYAEEAVVLDPLREIGEQLLIAAHTAAGNRSEALRTYERFRQLLAEELGADPSPETEALHLRALGK